MGHNNQGGLVKFENINKYFSVTAQKMKFSMKDFFSKCDQILGKLPIWSHLLKKSLMENFIFVQCVFKKVLGYLQKFMSLSLYIYSTVF